MEILQADDKLREEILTDARKKAERIVKKAEKEAQAINKKVDSDLKSFEESFSAGVEEAVANEKRLLFSSIDIEVRKRNLLFIGEKIDTLFLNVKERLIKEVGYLNVIKKLILKAAALYKSEAYILEIGQLEKIKEDELKELKLSSGTIKSVDKGYFRRGFKLFTEDKKLFSFISLDKFIEDLKAEKRNEVFADIKGR